VDEITKDNEEKNKRIEKTIPIEYLIFPLKLDYGRSSHVCKPEAANTVGAPDDERRTALNMLSF
jgi:hypothetical protein